MSDLFGNHIVGFPTRWLIIIYTAETKDVKIPMIPLECSNRCKIAFDHLRMMFMQLMQY